MQRVKTATAVTSKPPYSADGTPGFFTRGDAVAGIPATMPGQDFFNMVQEELLHVIIAAGLTPSATDDTQLRQAVLTLIESYSPDLAEATTAEVLAGLLHTAYLSPAGLLASKTAQGITTGVDYNTLTSSGVWLINNHAANTNAPGAANYYVANICYDSSTLVQRAWRSTSSDTATEHWYRVRSAGTWTSWTLMVDSNDLVAARTATWIAAATVTDYNSLTAIGGIWYVNGNVGNANGPPAAATAGTAYYVANTSYTATTLVQRAIRATATTTAQEYWIRCNHSGAWTAWTRVPLVDTVQGWTGQQYPVPVVRTGASGSQAVDLDLHQVLSITATGALTIAAPTHMLAGKTCVLLLYNSTASTQTLSWGTAWHGTSLGGLTTSLTPGKLTMFSFLCVTTPTGTYMVPFGQGQEA